MLTVEYPVSDTPRDRSSDGRRHSLGRMVVSSTVLLLFTIGTLIIVLALLILFDHNINATKGYKLRSFERVRNQLLVQQESLNMDIARSQALLTLEGDPKIISMEKVKKPTYVKEETPIARQNAVDVRPTE